MTEAPTKAAILVLMMFVAASFTLTACGGDDDDDDDKDSGGDADDDDDVDDDEGDDDVDIVAEGCGHMVDGPFEDLTAAVDTAGAPAVDNDHAAYRIAFTDVSGGLGGFTSFNASAAGGYHFFLSLDVPFSIFGSDGSSTIEIGSSAPVDDCEAVAIQHVTTLEAGQTYLFFGPTDMTNQATVVIEFEPVDG